MPTGRSLLSGPAGGNNPASPTLERGAPYLLAMNQGCDEASRTMPAQHPGDKCSR